MADPGMFEKFVPRPAAEVAAAGLMSGIRLTLLSPFVCFARFAPSVARRNLDR